MTTASDPLVPDPPVAPGVTIMVNGEPKEVPPALPRDEVLKMIEDIRKEEKDKLYPQLEELRGTVQTLTKEREAEHAAEIERQQSAAKEEQDRLLAEQTEIERLALAQQETNRQLEIFREEADTQRALREREAEFAELERYRYQRIEQLGEQIAPQFRDLVRGSNQDEIEASLYDMASRTSQIAEEFNQVLESQGLQMRRQTAPPVTGTPSNEPGTGDVNGDRQVTLSPDDIRNMSIEEYSQYRTQLLRASSDSVARGGAYQ